MGLKNNDVPETKGKILTAEDSHKSNSEVSV